MSLETHRAPKQLTLECSAVGGDSGHFENWPRELQLKVICITEKVHDIFDVTELALLGRFSLCARSCRSVAGWLQRCHLRNETVDQFSRLLAVSPHCDISRIVVHVTHLHWEKHWTPDGSTLLAFLRSLIKSSRSKLQSLVIDTFHHKRLEPLPFFKTYVRFMYDVVLSNLTILWLDAMDTDDPLIQRRFFRLLPDHAPNLRKLILEGKLDVKTFGLAFRKLKHLHKLGLKNTTMGFWGFHQGWNAPSDISPVSFINNYANWIRITIPSINIFNVQFKDWNPMSLCQHLFNHPDGKEEELDRALNRLDELGFAVRKRFLYDISDWIGARKWVQIRVLAWIVGRWPSTIPKLIIEMQTMIKEQRGCPTFLLHRIYDELTINSKLDPVAAWNRVAPSFFAALPFGKSNAHALYHYRNHSSAYSRLGLLDGTHPLALLCVSPKVRKMMIDEGHADAIKKIEQTPEYLALISTPAGTRAWKDY